VPVRRRRDSGKCGSDRDARSDDRGGVLSKYVDERTAVRSRAGERRAAEDGVELPLAAAVTLALAMLARRALTRAEVAEKLVRRVGPDTRDAVLARLEELRLLDDRGLAERIAHDGLVRRGFGRHRIRSELVRRGVEPAVAEDAIGRVFEGEAERAAAETALARFRKRRARGRFTPQKEAAAEFRHLIGRGFPAGLVRDLLRDIREVSL